MIEYEGIEITAETAPTIKAMVALRLVSELSWRPTSGEVLPLLMAAAWIAGLDPTVTWAGRRLGDVWRVAFGQLPLDLKRAQLQRASLPGADLSGLDLPRVDLSWANLREANLAKATLRDASLRGARLERARLEGATLSHVDVSKAHFEEADLRRVDLSKLDLKGAWLRGARGAPAQVQPQTRQAPGDDPEGRVARVGQGDLGSGLCGRGHDQDGVPPLGLTITRPGRSAPRR